MFLEIFVISVVISATSCHIPQNSSDVIIIREHPDTGHDAVFVSTGTPWPSKVTTDDGFLENEKTATEHASPLEQKDEVVFIPTKAPLVIGEGDVVHEDTIRIADVLENRRSMDSLMRTTEPPETDGVLFIQGKNDERQNNAHSEENKGSGRRRYMDYEDNDEATTQKVVMDCVNLNCDNTIESVCGAKTENKELKYRLFLNECYFRKVNCMFNYETNRYAEVDLSFCKNAGVHEARKNNQLYNYQSYVYHPMDEPRKKRKKPAQAERRMNSRRAMAMNLMGGYCNHLCPKTCTDDYKPECALSIRGQRKTFANHCHLDRASCLTNTLWRRRPLSECVGGKKADVHQNRAFIGWMQRVGIVDGRGRLVSQDAQ